MSKQSLKQNMAQNRVENKRAIEAFENVIHFHLEKEKRKKEFSK
jgi:hypothetical protein